MMDSQFRIIVLVCIFHLLISSESTRFIAKEDSLHRSSFPTGFLFGTAGSAYQYEGGAREGGRGPSVWDTFSHTPGKIDDGSNGDVAADSYHRYKEDVQLLKEMGLDAYRFSISWSRVLPKGTLEGGINRAGIDYYNALINETIKHGIQPFVTLFHWDLPQALEDKYKGFLDNRIVNDFGDYVELCFKEFGDRVKQWTTLNEPFTYAIDGYDRGTKAPGHCSPYTGNCSVGNAATEPYIVAHNLILAHAKAVSIYRTKYQELQKGIIGITLCSYWMVPYSEDIKDKKAALRALDFMYGWFIHPIVKGRYPKSMRQLVRNRLPKFSPDETKLVKGSFDFIGLNYYSARFVANVEGPPNPALASYYHDQLTSLRVERNGTYIGPKTAADWVYIYPLGLRELLLYTKHKYGNPLVYITESGVAEYNMKGMDLKDALNDKIRVKFYADHLTVLKNTLKEGVNVKGYFPWSLLDNFEWSYGYTLRFGLHYVDFNNGTLDRYPKASVKWFKNFLGPSFPSQRWSSH